MLQFGCPHAKDPKSRQAGTGNPPGGSSFTCNGKTIARDAGGESIFYFRTGNCTDDGVFCC